MKNYDYCIIGAGLTGCTLARILTDKGFSVIVLEKESTAGGLCRTETKDDIVIHKYGPHIFHTNNEKVWKFLKKHTHVNDYIHIAKSCYQNKLYDFPVNLNTIEKLEENKIKKDIIEVFYKEYSEKQWGVKFEDVPESIIERIKIRKDRNENWFTDKYQGIPNYSNLFINLLEGIKVKYNYTNYEKIDYRKLILTSSIDEFYKYKYGQLKYRSCKWDYIRIGNNDKFQDYAIINYPEGKFPYTRIIEHKYFNPVNCDYTYVSFEYPVGGGIPMYPFNDKKNNSIYSIYKKHANNDKLYICGRLAEYKYMNMDEAIFSAMELSECI